MSFLADVNILLAAAWDTHVDHQVVRKWITTTEGIYTCPITELGFVRVSMTPAYHASFSTATGFLSDLKRLKMVQSIEDNVWVEALPEVSSYKDTTDAYLVALAAKNDLHLATLDNRLINKPWAKGVALNPFKNG